MYAPVAASAVAVSERARGVHAAECHHRAAVDRNRTAFAVVASADACAGKLAACDEGHDQIVGEIDPALFGRVDAFDVFAPETVIPDIIIIQITAGRHQIAAVDRQRAAVSVVAAADTRAFIFGNRIDRAAVDRDIAAVAAAASADQRTAAADACACIARSHDEGVSDINVSAVACGGRFFLAAAAADARAVAVVVDQHDAAGDADVSALAPFYRAADGRALALRFAV